MISYSRLKKHPRNLAFVSEFDSLTQQHPFNRELRLHAVQHGDEVCAGIFELTDGFNDGEMTLGYITSNPRQVGAGSSALDWFLALADKHSIAISIDIQPQGDRKLALNKTQLKAWYKRRGFKISGDKGVREAAQ